MNTLYKSFIFALATHAPIVFSQAQVVDSTPIAGAGAQPINQQQNEAQVALPATDFYYQMQLLQQEVLELRGMIEEQSHELKKLKQQRLDDYLDLDRRLSQGGNIANAPRTLPNINDSASTSSSTSLNVSSSSAQEENQSYRDAIDLVLRKKDYAAAAIALKNHLGNYPQGSTAANAHYWLGELYLKEENLDTAQKWFGDLLEKFPTHSKVADTKYKLGQVLFMKGQKDQARTLLDEVAQMSGSASNLAKRFIANNY